MIAIQLSDPHIVAPGELLYGRVDTAEFLARSVAEINRLDPLDTLVPGEAGGLLCSERLAWLDHALASAPARPVLLMMHHPPFLTGIARMDRAGLQNSQALAAVGS